MNPDRSTAKQMCEINLDTTSSSVRHRYQRLFHRAARTLGGPDLRGTCARSCKMLQSNPTPRMDARDAACHLCLLAARAGRRAPWALNKSQVI